MAYPSFFLGDIPEMPEELSDLTSEQVWGLAFSAGAEHASKHINDYWLELKSQTNQTVRIYQGLTYRIDWLVDIFNNISPNPTGETP